MAVLPPEENMQISIPFKANLQGTINIKFLLRYEVSDDKSDKPLPDVCRYRFQRMQFAVTSNQPFVFIPRVHLSSKNIDEFIVNIQTNQKSRQTNTDLPVITAIEIIKYVSGIKKKDEDNKDKIEGIQREDGDWWNLDYKGQNPNFFIVKPSQKAIFDA